MAKLNDTQTLLLSAASQREDGSLMPLPDGRTLGARVNKAFAGLLAAKLIEERETSSTDAECRTDGDLSFGLFITPAGLAAIEIGDEKPDGGNATETGGDAAATVAPVAPAPAPRQTKAAAVLALLAREGGATLPELIDATGWLPHTTRAALTGLRKKGHALERNKRDGATCYRIGRAA